MRRALAALACTAAFAATPVVPVASAQTSVASITAVGWWSQRPGAAPLPKGSFEVALLPNAPQSQAALRIDVTTIPLTSALLQLTESQQVFGDVARIDACPTNDPWTPANPGAWADAPSGSCAAASVALGRNADGTWTADVASILRAGTSSIVLVPSLEFSDAQQSAAFQIAFSGAQITAHAAAAPTNAPEPAPMGTSDVASPSFAPDIPAGPVELPSGPVVAAPTVAPASTPPADSGRAVDAVNDEGTSKPWSRLAYGVPLSLLAGFGAVVARRLLQQRGVIEG